jgi:predicted nucleotidyltransferase
MPTEQSPDLLHALKVVAATLREAKVPFALAGGLAAWAHGGPATEHDIDLMIREVDAETALSALRDAGLEVDAPPEGWLVKAWLGDVLVDLIFSPKGFTVDDEFLDGCDEICVAAVDMRVVSLEDLLVSKLLALTEHNLDFGPPLEWARAIREQVDWQVVAARTAGSPFARTFLAMLDELEVVPRQSPLAAP